MVLSNYSRTPAYVETLFGDKHPVCLVTNQTFVRKIPISEEKEYKLKYTELKCGKLVEKEREATI